MDTITYFIIYLILINNNDKKIFEYYDYYVD